MFESIVTIFHVLVVMLLVHILRTEGQGQFGDPIRVPTKILNGDICPSDQDTIDAKNELRQNISAVLADLPVSCGGTPGWRRVGYLDMTDPSQSCPSGLTLKDYSPGLRSCGRVSDTTGCGSTYYSTAGVPRYNKVCGRIRGYQYSATSGFQYASQGIDSTYVEGVSLTHGQSGDRTHIWTFAAGLAEVFRDRYADQHCTCVTTSGSQPPAFVANDYFCESGENSAWTDRYIFYRDDPLWDGQNCASSSCCQPPYFIRTLPTPTSDDIELRVCAETLDGDSPIDQVELYVQ